MSTSATGADDDASTMTRDAMGASRTFRSIFGDGAANHDGEAELKLQRFSRHHDKDMDANGYRDGVGDGGDDAEEDDDGVWSDDGAPPNERQNGDEDCERGDNNNGDEQALNDSAAAIATTATAEEHGEDEEGDWGSSDASAPRSEELKIPHRRSMEEWADDDDEEDAWKDMLQAKVNQLELVIQSNNEASASSSSSQMPPPAAVIAQVEFAHADSRIALATATHTASLRTTTTDRPTSRNKIQRLTSGGHSQASGDHSHSHHRHIGTTGGVHASAAPAVSSPSNYLRKRSGSRDFASNRAAKPADSKKSAKVASGSSSSRRDSLTRSSSASSLATTITRSAHAAQRKNSLDACSTASHSHNRAANGTLDAVGGSTAAASAVRAVPEPLQPISDAEAVRRFILQDIKHMSMDRLVADAKRLRFLEDFYAERTQKEHEEEAQRDAGATS